MNIRELYNSRCNEIFLTKKYIKTVTSSYPTTFRTTADKRAPCVDLWFKPKKRFVKRHFHTVTPNLLTTFGYCNYPTVVTAPPPKITERALHQSRERTSGNRSPKISGGDRDTGRF